MVLWVVEASKLDGATVARLVAAEGVGALWIAATVEAVQLMQPTLRDDAAAPRHVLVSGPLAPHHSARKALTQTQSPRWFEDRRVERVALPYPEADESVAVARDRLETALTYDLYREYARSAWTVPHMVVLDGSTLGAFDNLLNVGETKLAVQPRRQRGVVAKYALAEGQTGLVLEKQVQ